MGSRHTQPEGGVEASESVWRRGRGFRVQPVGGARRWSSTHLEDRRRECFLKEQGRGGGTEALKLLPRGGAKEVESRFWSFLWGRGRGGGVEALELFPRGWSEEVEFWRG